MSRQHKNLLMFIALQLLAVIIYPPTLFASSPQATIAPPALLILLLLTLITINTRSITLESGRNSLAFIQGVNITIRLLMLFPNLYDAEGNLHLFLFATQIAGIGLSWRALSILEKWRLAQLLFKEQMV